MSGVTRGISKTAKKIIILKQKSLLDLKAYVTPGYTWVPSKKFSQIGPAVEPATANISENTG